MKKTKANPTPESKAQELDFVRRVLSHESQALANLTEHVDDDFTKAIDLIVETADAGGTVLVSGLGKSGHIGAKISATMASLGITSHTVHPTEAAHGDLGRFRSCDLVVCLSHSGETSELVSLAAILRQDKLPIIAITRGSSDGRPKSSLQRLADVTLETLVTDEAGDGAFLAPSSSTTATLALGDALALAAARRRSFTHEDFHARHPGGTLGNLLRPIDELIRFRVGENLPIAHIGQTLSEALTEASNVKRRPGALIVVDGDQQLAGIFTDSDLRRLVLNDPAKLNLPIEAVMSPNPKSLPADALIRDAVVMFREYRADEIPIIDEHNRPTGMLDVQDLIAMKLVEDV